MPGVPELVIILVIVVILFGVGKLPKVLGQMGKGVKAFKEGVQGKEITNLDDEEAVDVTPEDAPIAIDEKPDDPVEEAEEVVAAAPAEPDADADEDEERA